MKILLLMIALTVAGIILYDVLRSRSANSQTASPVANPGPEIPDPYYIKEYQDYQYSTA